MPTNRRDSAKAKRATFANYIKKKDAAIAIHVVHNASRYGVDVYTVHDCFISPAVHAGKLSSLYTQAFIDLAHPLHLLNSFFYINLMAYSSKRVQSLLDRFSTDKDIFYSDSQQELENMLHSESCYELKKILKEPFQFDVELLKSYMNHLDMPAEFNKKDKTKCVPLTLLESSYFYCQSIGAEKLESTRVSLDKYLKFLEEFHSSMNSANCKALLPK